MSKINVFCKNLADKFLFANQKSLCNLFEFLVIEGSVFIFCDKSWCKFEIKNLARQQFFIKNFNFEKI